MEQAQIVQNTTNLTTLNSKKSISSAILAIFVKKSNQETFGIFINGVKRMNNSRSVCVALSNIFALFIAESFI